MNEETPATFLEFVQLWNLVEAEKSGDPKRADIPDVHRRIIDFIETTEHKPMRVILAFRNAGKSYLLSLYIAWRLYLNPNFTCGVVSANDDLATTRSVFIRTVIVNHPLTSHLAPKKRGGGDPWKANTFTVIRSGHGMAPSVSVKSIASGLTGHHYDLCAIDDVEIRKNVDSDAKRERLKEQFEELHPVSNSRFLIVGTYHHEQGLLNGLNTESKKYHWHVETAYNRPPSQEWLAGDLTADPGEAAWPEMVGLDDLETKFTENKPGYFLSQYLMQPTSTVEAMLEPRFLKFYNAELEVDNFKFKSNGQAAFSIDGKSVRKLTSYWDPALGSKFGDNSVLAIVAITDTNEIYVLDVCVLCFADKRLDDPFENQMKEALFNLRRFKCNEIYIEDNFAKTLPSHFRTFVKNAGYHIKVKPDTRTGNKSRLISDTLEPLLRFGRLYVHNRIATGPFQTEMRHHPGGKHDDTLDAVSAAILKLPGFKNIGKSDKPLTMPHSSFGRPKVSVINRYRMSR